MGNRPLAVPPEHLWPTGAMPRELRTTMAVENYQPPPRPAPNLQELEAERQIHAVAMPPQQLPLPLQPQHMLFSLPLGHGKHAEIRLIGPVNRKDIQRLMKYVELMSDIEDAPVPDVVNGQAPKAKRPPRGDASST